jgi:GntR family transcriptional repressor for pyruvate dehydrogenase complex
MFKVIESRMPVSKIVAQQIEEAIMSKRFLPGSKLPSELELCKSFGVSRTAIREALQTLSAKNLITIIKGKGIYVHEMTKTSVTEPLNKYLQQKLDKHFTMDLVHARQVIEPPLAAYAAERRTEEDIETLIADYNTLKEYSGDFHELAKLDMKFHLDLAHASHNKILPVLLEPIIQSFMPEVKAFVYETIHTAKDSAIESHWKVLDCIINQDAKGAYEAMIAHLKIAEVHTESMLSAKYSDGENGA